MSLLNLTAAALNWGESSLNWSEFPFSTDFLTGLVDQFPNISQVEVTDSALIDELTGLAAQILATRMATQRSAQGTTQTLENLEGNADAFTQAVNTAIALFTEITTPTAEFTSFSSALNRQLYALQAAGLQAIQQRSETFNRLIDRLNRRDSGLTSTLFSSGLFTPELFTGVAPYTVPEGAAAFTTVAFNGERYKNGNRGTEPEIKWTRTTTRADGTTATAISFAFDKTFSLTGLSSERAKALFVSALETWAKHAPLEFQEIEAPDSADDVDILVQSRDLDGPGKTLAEAYFPTVGDITFDQSENWQAPRFLETAVHEIGHSLGLDHENETPSVLNSVLGNLYTAVESPFILDDDIAGIQSLYGAGVGSVQTLTVSNETAEPLGEEALPNEDEAAPGALPALGPNLVANGSFETIPLEINDVGLYSQINSWSTISGIGFKVDKRVERLGPPTDGEAWAELDIYNINGTIGQNINTVTGQRYLLSVDYSTGGQALDTTGIDVFWEGVAVDSLTGELIENPVAATTTEAETTAEATVADGWKTFTYELIGSDRAVSTLAFRATGIADGIGGLIDNITVKADLGASAVKQTEDPLNKDPLNSGAVALTAAEDLSANLFPIAESFV